MPESSSQAGYPKPSQYHHFIPRFLLRNFAVFKNPGKVVPKTSTKSKNRAPNPQKLTVLDLQSGDFQQGDVGDTFGIVDMYRDFEGADQDQHKLEKELSVLESEAGKIFARVKQLYDAGKKEVQLLRRDRDLLRRFLFIMMYRNTKFAGRFEKSKEDYDSNDRKALLAYMDEKGFQRPRDVWFANIRAFLEADLTKELPDVLSDIRQRAYPMDANWFFMHMQMSFLAFCTPRKDADEFLLTQNVYSCFEGPSGAGFHTDYHRFAPVSPRIMIVLRSNLLPCADVEEDENNMQRLLELTKSMHLDPNTAGSWLEDLPVTRARNNYSQVVNGKVELLPTEISRDKHIFHFPFFSLDHEHVQKINMICLEQAAGMKTIVYKSRDNLRTALDYYLTDKTLGFKQVYPPPPDDPRYLHMVLQEDGQIRLQTEDKLLPYLQLLHKFARQLGSSVELEYNLMNPAQTILVPAMTVEQKARYEKLGGTSASFSQDYDQAQQIVQLITKVDSLLRNSRNDITYVVRQNREDLIAALPPRRVWLSIKHLRSLMQDHTNSQTMNLENAGGKEDAIVDGKPDSSLYRSSHIFKADALTRVIYRVFDITHFLDVHPDFGLVSALSSVNEGAVLIRQELELVFKKPGTIRNCGIADIENAAQWLATQPGPGREAMGNTSLYRFLSDEQMLEVQARLGAEIGFEAILKDKLGAEELQALKDVFFQTLYRSEFGGRMPG